MQNIYYRARVIDSYELFYDVILRLVESNDSCYYEPLSGLNKGSKNYTL